MEAADTTVHHIRHYDSKLQQPITEPMQILLLYVQNDSLRTRRSSVFLGFSRTTLRNLDSILKRARV